MPQSSVAPQYISPDLLTDATSEQSWNIRYLLKEIERIGLILQFHVEQRQGGDDYQNNGIFIGENNLKHLFDPIASAVSNEAADAFVHRYDALENELAQMAADMVEQGGYARFHSFIRVFGFSQFERDLFLMALAPVLDARFGRIMGFLNDDMTARRPTVQTILDVLVHSQAERLALLPLFFEESRLMANRLVRRAAEGSNSTPGAITDAQLLVEESVLSWLLGVYQASGPLNGYVKLMPAEISTADLLLTSEIWEGLIEGINGQSIAIFHGKEWGTQDAAALMLASNMGRMLLDVDLARLVKGGTTPLEAIRLLLRDARMTQSVLYLRGWDKVATDSAPSRAMTELLFGADVPVVLGCEEPWHAYGVDRQSRMMHIKFTALSFRQRQQLWEHFLAQVEEPVAEDVDLVRLASQFSLDSRQIRDAVFSAQDIAVQKHEPIYQRELVNAARIHSSPNLSGLAQKIEPRYEWDDIVLPEEQRTILQELVNMVRGRGVVMDEWGVGRKLKTSSGVAVLFAGPPGTGKTMSAEVVAKELGLDLYKIDLSTVVSKYIGETEKNLGKIFDEAQSSSAVLFFDEADSVFGKRSEVKDSHDRYANMEISYLLQRMEQYDGITILATNLRANMDEAFTRRMQFILDYPFPDEEERLHIWRTLLPADLPQGDDINLELLASRFKLAGGNIRNVIASAAFQAAANGGVVTMAHLIHGTRRELQKMGRLISDMDLTF